MKFPIRLIVFLLINFSVLILSGVTQGEGPFSQWYQNLNKAPWTPPGWCFGVAWTLIMISFSVYMAFLLQEDNWLPFRKIYFTQLFLTAVWNPIYFILHWQFLSLLILLLLLYFLLYSMLLFYKKLKWKSLFILPFILWLLIASSLNYYTWSYN